MYSRPSEPHSLEPKARATNTGPPPTARNALTGLFTPPGKRCSARARSAPEAVFVMASPKLLRNAGGREAHAHFLNFGGHAIEQRAVVGRAQHAVHEAGKLLHFVAAHAARGDGGRADTNPGRVEGLTRIE